MRVYMDVCACVCVPIHTKWLLNKRELVVILRCIIHSIYSFSFVSWSYILYHFNAFNVKLWGNCSVPSVGLPERIQVQPTIALQEKQSLQTRFIHPGSAYVHIKAKIIPISTSNHLGHLKILRSMSLQVIWAEGRKLQGGREATGWRNSWAAGLNSCTERLT